MSEEKSGPGWREVYDEAKTAWPSIALAFVAFEAHAIKVNGPSPRTGGYAADLYLACACGAGDSRALSILEQRYLGPARSSLYKLDSRPEFIDDVMQELRTKLLVGTDPRIAHYEGRGPLLAWIRVAATRTGIDLLRTIKPAAPIDGEGGDVLKHADLGPEVRLLRESYRDAFKEALATTLSDLSAKDRNLLRRHLVDNLTLQEIAAPYGVHLATVARRLATLREEIAEAVRVRLAAAHREAGGSTSLESLAYAIRSEIHLSLGALLSSSSPAPVPPKGTRS